MACKHGWSGNRVSPVTAACFDGVMSIDALDIIRTESQRSADALAATDPEQKVPTCPEWTASDLLWHLVEVQEFWTTILADGATTEQEVVAIEEAKSPRPEGTDALLVRREAATTALLAQLQEHADEEPAWFWYSAEQTVGVTRRMQTHESTIHRVDAELTAGRPVTPLDAERAAASLEHVLDVMWPGGFEWIPDWATVELRAVAEIRPEDGTRSLLGISHWSGTRPRDGEEFEGAVGRRLEDPTAAEGLPRATVSGTAPALALWAWGRQQALAHLADGAAKVEIQGDPAAITALEALIAEGHD